MHAGAAAWLMVTVVPAIVIVPVRAVKATFAVTEYVTVPLPVPVLPLVTVMNESLLAADHEQPVCVVTVSLPVPAALLKLLLVGETV